jgi:hypothetical protein
MRSVLRKAPTSHISGPTTSRAEDQAAFNLYSNVFGTASEGNAGYLREMTSPVRTAACAEICGPGVWWALAQSEVDAFKEGERASFGLMRIAEEGNAG